VNAVTTPCREAGLPGPKKFLKAKFGHKQFQKRANSEN